MSFSRRVAGLNLERRMMSAEESCYPKQLSYNPHADPNPAEEPPEVAQTGYILGVSLGDTLVLDVN